MKSKILSFVTVVAILFSCRDEEENPLSNELIGSYDGVVLYYFDPIPGDEKVENLTFAVTKVSEDEIKISTTFDLVLPVTGTFTTEKNGDTHKIISLGAGKDITYISNNGIEINSGNTAFEDWGKMCGYYDATDKTLMITFGWTNGTAGGGGHIYGTQKE